MIRYLENNEKQNIRPLYEHCFDDTKEYTDYYFQNRLPGNHVIVNERDNKIVNCVHLIPKTVILGKLKTNIIYIYGVGTSLVTVNVGFTGDLVKLNGKDQAKEGRRDIPSTRLEKVILEAR